MLDTETLQHVSFVNKMSCEGLAKVYDMSGIGWSNKIGNILFSINLWLVQMP